MNEANQILTQKLEQLESLLKDFPNITHIYMRRADDVLVDISRDAAKATITRHPDWTIENKQPIGKTTSLPPETNSNAGLDNITPSDTQTTEEEINVPAKPSEEKNITPKGKTKTKSK